MDGVVELDSWKSSVRGSNINNEKKLTVTLKTSKQEPPKSSAFAPGKLTKVSVGPRMVKVSKSNLK